MKKFVRALYFILGATLIFVLIISIIYEFIGKQFTGNHAIFFTVGVFIALALGSYVKK